MKRAILSRLQPFLAWPRSRSEAAIKGQVTMNGTFQWNSIWHGGFGGMQVPGGGLRGMQIPWGGLQGLGDAEHPPRMGLVQPLSASRSPRDGRHWKNIWMHPWIEGDKQGAAAIWGWAWRCCLGKAGGVGAGGEVGKGSGCSLGMWDTPTYLQYHYKTGKASASTIHGRNSPALSSSSLRSSSL